jgi:hypothetical protein
MNQSTQVQLGAHLIYLRQLVAAIDKENMGDTFENYEGRELCAAVLEAIGAIRNVWLPWCKKHGFPDERNPS